jgi:hypothetical protein
MTGDHRPSTGDQLFLQPINCISGLTENDFLQPLRNSISTRHIASATCVESRKVVVELFSDTLLFRHLPKSWGWDENLGPRFWHLLDPPNAASFPQYILRFNGAKDIIVLHADWVDQETAVKIASLRGSPPDDFLNIRHVGIAVDKFTKRHCSYEPHRYRTDRCTCMTEECQDDCKKEPLRAFLSLFPLLEKFYIAGVPRSSTHQPSDQIRAGKDPSGGANCPCSNEEPRHSWPMIRSTDVCGWFAIYDERSACPFPKFDKVENLRRHWRPHFPYYRALDHLEIRFIQLWDQEFSSSSLPCNGCVYNL